MAKVSPKDRKSKTPKQKRRLRSSSSNKYLRPGALAQLRYSRASTAYFGKKKVAVLDVEEVETDIGLKNKVIDDNTNMLSPQRFINSSVATPMGLIKKNTLLMTPKSTPTELFQKNNLLRTPVTPQAEECQFESRLESLPMDLLVKILCHLHHDQLRAVFHVSKRIRQAVMVARQIYFNYTTPDRSRQEMLSTMTPHPKEHWPFLSKGDGKNIRIMSPNTPKAPRQGPRPPRPKSPELRQIAAVLFQERLEPISKHRTSKCKSLASNRVLFYEDELCQAVVQNKLR